MKLKYYLRGLGIGIIVTAVIMTVAFGNKQPMTDEEVVKRAKELGMIENSVLVDRAEKDVESNVDEETDKEVVGDEIVDNEVVSDEIVDNEAVSDEETDGEISQEDTEKEDTKKEDTEKQDTVKEDTEKETTQKDVVSITVVGGDTSWTVSKRMEEAGLIDSAKDFDTHLCRYGYDKKISVGTYDIPKSATPEEMAKIITKMD